MNAEDAIYRVLFASTGKETFRGTAFAIAPNCFLTCAHVLDNCSETASVVLRGPARHGDLAGLQWHRHERLDCACALLVPGAGGVEAVLPVKLRDVTSDLGELDCRGYFDAASGLQRWADRVSGNSFKDGWIALQNSIAASIL